MRAGRNGLWILVTVVNRLSRAFFVADMYVAHGEERQKRRGRWIRDRWRSNESAVHIDGTVRGLWPGGDAFGILNPLSVAVLSCIKRSDRDKSRRKLGSARGCGRTGEPKAMTVLSSVVLTSLEIGYDMVLRQQALFSPRVRETKTPARGLLRNLHSTSKSLFLKCSLELLALWAS